MPAQIGEVTSRRWKCGICGTVGTVKICVMQFGMSLKRTSPSIFTVLYCTVLFSFAFYCAALYCAVFICILLCCVVLCCFHLYFTVLHCTVLFSFAFYCAVLYCVVFNCILLCYVVPHLLQEDSAWTREWCSLSLDCWFSSPPSAVFSSFFTTEVRCPNTCSMHVWVSLSVTHCRESDISRGCFNRHSLSLYQRTIPLCQSKSAGNASQPIIGRVSLSPAKNCFHW